MRPAANPDASLRFCVLGPLEVDLSGVRTAIGPPKQRALLAALLTQPGRAVGVERLMDELWPEAPPPTAAAALQVHVAGLRRVVGERLRTTTAGYRLLAEPEEIDYCVFESLVVAPGAGEDVDLVAQRLRAGLAMWRGDPFEGVARGPLVASAAARLRGIRQRAREDLTHVELRRGHHREILAEAHSWVVESPTAERLVASLMLALHQCGRSGEAITIYEKLRQRLAAEFDTEPEAATTALAAAIRRRDPTLDAPPRYLPTPPSRFIGRRRELDAAAAALGVCRLLTVTGPGGCGKSRFAIELAREVSADYPDGAFFVELAGLPGPPAVSDGVAGAPLGERETLAAQVADVVGLRDQPRQAATQTLAAWAGKRRILLVLDNCEHVRAAVAWLAEQLLSSCPAVRILATSREPLSGDGEVVFALDGLRLPAVGAGSEEALRSDAVRLLAERMERARGAGGLRPDEASLATELVRRLDGLPLGIELAAARLRALTMSDLMNRLDRALDLLVGSSVNDRHRTMRACIDWGHDLLLADERVLFRRLGVLVGNFDLATAQTIGADPDGDAPHEAADILDPLIRLVDRSLVVCDPGAARPYRLIETIREYSLERLRAAREEDLVRGRHARHFEAMVTQPPPMDGLEHASWLERMRQQHDNVRAALGWALEEGKDPELALSITSAMWWFWWVTGQMAEGRAWLGRAVNLAGPEISVRLGHALRAAASLARNSGDLADARSLGERALQVFIGLDDRAGVVSALNNLAITAQGQGDFDASLEHGFAAVRRAQAEGPPRALAAALNNTAGTLRCLGRLDEAHALFTRALVLFRELADRRGEAAALFNLGVVARRREDLSGARDLALRCLELYWELALVEGQLDAIEAIAYVDAFSGRPASAARLLALAARERARLGAPIFTPDEIADRQRAENAARAAVGDDANHADTHLDDLDSLVRGLLGMNSPSDALVVGLQQLS